ncbi:tautomerase family protein [Mycolicibacterium mengxianglii]|uniref:tautomerase family protein n=1 Tax=Mycolicibacterium mengxianglii TaxID=2736649 RepID=UPI0018D113CA|nr:tautomerase family protein [Mycolicibacterium mengxianglii]
MPLYTVTTTESTMTANTKAQLAGEIARIHSVINHVPAAYVNVVFVQLPADSVYAGGAPAEPVLVSGWVRAGHPVEDVSRLALEVAAAVTRVSGVPAEHVTVVFQSSPAQFAVDGGRLLPEPGHEGAWVTAGSDGRVGG